MSNTLTEYQEFRGDDELTRTFEEGFGWKAIIGGLFVGFLMVPGGMFLGLMVGGVGYAQAVEWVTIIFFTEIARRCRTSLTKQETYVLFSCASGVLMMSIGSYFQNFIWNQYLMQSPFAFKFGIAHRVPIWVAPPPGSEAFSARSLLHFVMPFWAVVGSAIGSTLGRLVLNPMMYHLGVLKTWTRGSNVIETSIANGVDFWMSFGIGTSVGVAVIGIVTAVRHLLRSKNIERRGKGSLATPEGRGDYPIPLAILLYVVSTTATIVICHSLVPKFPIWILLVFGFIYTKMGEIPSSAYPYAMRFWPQTAFWQCFWRTATTTGNDYFMQAINKWTVLGGASFALVTYSVLSLFHLPTLLLYGVITGIQAEPTNAVPMLIAAMVGRYYFAKRFGPENWRRYTPILAAGYGCGFGLIGMVSVAVTLISKAVSQMPF